MSKKSIVEREKKRKIFQLKYTHLRSELKYKLKEANSIEGKLYYQALLQDLPRNSSESRIV